MLVLSSEKELGYSEKMKNAHGDSKRTYWYGDTNFTFNFAPEVEKKINGTKYSECQEFNPFADGKKMVRWASSCDKKNEFICRKIRPELFKFDGPQTVLETTLQHSTLQSNIRTIIIVVAVVALIIGAIIIFKCCYKASQPVAITKLPTSTPI